MASAKNPYPTCKKCAKILSVRTAQYCSAHKALHPNYIESRKNRIYTEEEKARLRTLRIGIPHTEEWKAKMRNRTPWNKGFKNPKARYNPQTFKKGMIPWNKGLKKGDAPGIRYGERINTWKGGITPINEYLRRTTEYKEWRNSVFKRDNYTCVLCGDRTYKGRGSSLTLNADHIKPWSVYPELRFDISNGRTLCKPCHQKTDTYGGKSHKKHLIHKLTISFPHLLKI